MDAYTEWYDRANELCDAFLSSERLHDDLLDAVELVHTMLSFLPNPHLPR